LAHRPRPKPSSLFFSLAVLLAFACAGFSADAPALEEVTPGLKVVRGAVNGALLERNGKLLAFYGDPREQPAAVDTVLFTHHRRDVVWAGRGLVSAGARAVVPQAELTSFTDASKFWAEFGGKRFHDYAQQTTKLPGEPLPVAQSVRGGDTFQWQDIPVRVLDTPGYTRGAVTYLVELNGRRIAFTGDLIYGDGKVLDLYSLQDAIPEAKIGGYHGYAARLGDLLASLRQVAAQRPDVLVPARGPIIRKPAEAMAALTARAQALYANYLSIDALRWYFHEEHMRAKAKRVLGPPAQVDWLPMAETVEPLPPWIVPIDNSRLILAADNSGFLVDCGSQHILDELQKLHNEGKLATLEHAFITHYHDDHTDQAPKLVETFGCTVHASRQNWEVLENPGAHRLPCLTANPIHVSGRAESGSHWRWKEFAVTLYYFPGQTLYHDALLVKKDGGEQVFFIGDSFTPSGIDDYCLLNRNFVREGTGYLYCLGLLKQAAPGALLINEHVGPAFRFTGAQIDRMTDTLRKRLGLLQALLPWDDPNFGLDEGWARFYPYATRVRAGDQAGLSLRILNHSPEAQTFEARIHLPEDWSLRAVRPARLRIPARTEGAVQVRFEVPSGAAPGTCILTADLRWDKWDLREWTEAMVTVTQEE
jgi:glyoxylase-like metal-dependent hydrolase (beta-lactamase superfamily II)